MRLRAGLGTWALLLAFLATSCQGVGAPVRPGVTAGASPTRPFTEAVAGTAGYLDPLFADEDNSREIDSLIYQGLTRVGPGQQAEPLLASAITVSADRLTYMVTVRTDVLWADGTPFGIEDVLFTFAALQDPGYNGPEAAAWKGVTVKRAGDAIVAFSLKAPSAAFALSLRVGILPKHLFGGEVGTFPVNPHSSGQALGTGPFMVESMSPDRSLVTLKRNPRATPAARLEHVVFHGYSTLEQAARGVARGEADAVGGPDAAALEPALRRPGMIVSERGTFSFTAVYLNVAAAPVFFGNPAVRHALTQAIDRRRLINDVLGGRGDPQVGPLPPSDWAFSAADAGPPESDRTAAIRTLEEAGWDLPPQGLYRTRAGRDFQVRLVAADAYPYRQVATALRSQLLDIGVGIRLELVPIAQLVSRYLLARNYDMLLASYDNGPDPDQFVLWHSSQSAYPLNFSNLPRQPLIDKDLEDGRAGADQAARKPAYADFQRLMADAVPALFLYEPHYVYAVSRRVQGVRLNPAIDAPDRFEYIAEWSVG